MIPSTISRRIVGDRLATIAQAVADIQSLPIGDQDAFLDDMRNVWTAESCLRRAIEALLDIGRHVLAKGFASGVSEYKEVARGLQKHQVIDADTATLLGMMAGYRNRMVHFYHEIAPDELYTICTTRLDDVQHVANAYRTWIDSNPKLVSPIV